MHVLKLRKAFPKCSSANKKLSKTQAHKIGQLGGFLVRLLGPLLIPLGLIPLGLTAAAAATNAAIHKKMFESSVATLIILNEEMNDMKTVKSLEESGLLIKGISQAIKNETAEQKEGFLSLLRNQLTGKGPIRAGEGTIRAGQDF